MSRRRDRDYLTDIIEAMERTAAYTAGLTREQFAADRKTQDAVIRNLEVVGGAAKCLTGDLTAGHPEVPWRSLAGVRDRMIHHYFGVDLGVVWHIVTDDFPALLPQIGSILARQAE